MSSSQRHECQIRENVMSLNDFHSNEIELQGRDLVDLHWIAAYVSCISFYL